MCCVAWDVLPVDMCLQEICYMLRCFMSDVSHVEIFYMLRCVTCWYVLPGEMSYMLRSVTCGDVLHAEMSYIMRCATCWDVLHVEMCNMLDNEERSLYLWCLSVYPTLYSVYWSAGRRQGLFSSTSLLFLKGSTIMEFSSNSALLALEVQWCVSWQFLSNLSHYVVVYIGG